MSVVNPENERLKRRYAEYLREGQGLAESTIDQALRSISAYEAFGQFHDLARISQKRRAIAFKNELLAKISGRSGVSTAETKLRHLRCFFEWLADQAGYRRKLSTLDWHFFQLSGRDRWVARERAPQGCFTVEQWLQMIAASPCTTPAERRNQAMLCLLLLTGVRVGALITLKLKHVLPDQSGIHQDGYEVNTKLGRTFTTTFFPVGGRAKEVFGAYIAYLRSDLDFSDDDPLFPKSECEPIGGGFIWNALSRSHWETTDPVRSVLTQAAARASLPNFGPHSVRRTLVLLGQQKCKTHEQLKAWSQNLGHLSMLTTSLSYGGIDPERQALLIISLDKVERSNESLENLLKKALETLERKDQESDVC